MKPFILDILKFALYSCAAYLFLLILWGEFFPAFMNKNLNYKLGDTGHMHSRLAEAKTKSNIELLCLGSSLTYRGFDTRFFNQNVGSSFNFGSSSQTPIQSHLLAKRYLDQLNPKKIFLQVDPEAFAADGVESSLDIIANEKNDKHSFAMTLQIANLKTFNAFVYGCYRDLFSRNGNYIETPIKNGDKYIEGGYVEKEMAYANSEKIESYKFEFNANQKESFEALIQMIKEKKTEYLLVYPPVSSGAYHACKNNIYFDSCMHSYGNYINFNKELMLDDSLDFYDAYHLNQNGVKKFNAKVLEYF